MLVLAGLAEQSLGFGPQSDPSSLLPRVRAGEVGAGSSPQLAPSPSVDNHTGAAE